MKRILIINGSASNNSSNQKLIEYFGDLIKDQYELTVFNGLKTLPHFDTEHSVNNTPKAIIDFRNSIDTADGIVICTPEYIFSIPSGLKNAIEWCVSTTVFSDKPTGLITASASGEMGHQELQMIMRTVMAKFIPETTLLIQGVKGKISSDGDIIDTQLINELALFANAFKQLVEHH